MDEFFELMEACMHVLAVGFFAAFSWIVVLQGIKQKRMYDKEGTVTEAVITKKSAHKRQVGRLSETVYELDVVTPEGKQYHIITDSYRVKRYKENQKVAIIVPEKIGVIFGTDKKVILKTDKDSTFVIILGLFFTILFTLIFIIGIIGILFFDFL